ATGRLAAAGRGGSRLARAVFAAAALTVLHTAGVERAADDVIAHARQVLHAATANQHHGVLLQRVALAGDVCRHLDAVREANTRHFAQRRIRLFGRHRAHLRAHAALLRRANVAPRMVGERVVHHAQRRRLALLAGGLAPLADQLAD